MDFQRAINLAKRITAELSSLDGGLLDRYPVNQYIQSLDAYPEIFSYKYVSPEILKYCSDIVECTDSSSLELYHQLVLVSLILKAKERLREKNITKDIRNIYDTNFERVIENIETNKLSKGFYLYPQDKFLKDLGVCGLKIIPAGAQKINPSVLPKSFLYKKGLLQFISGALFVSFELGGFKPIYDMHTDSHDPDLMADFNSQGWRLFYKRVADLLRIETGIRGIYGTGWVFDPQLETISPRLKYLREIVTTNGGKLFYYGPSSSAVKNATFKSPTRRRLYEQGSYVPTDYMVVWSRQKIIQWADLSHS